MANVPVPRFVRFGMSLFLACAVVYLPLLPPEHIHRAGIEGRRAPLVHAHQLDGPDSGSGDTGTSGSLGVGHGNHGLAIFLSTNYRTVLRFVSPPIALVSAVVPIAPVFCPLGLVHAGFVQRDHSPPRSVWLTRGPPSLS
jgi:hypothetical protein